MSDVRTEKGDLVDGLRNCPFCGSEARWAATNIDGDWEIQCSNMGCPVIFIGRDETGRELAAAWNNRPELASWQARAEQAEAALELACQDAWPGEKQWPGLYLQQGQQVVALRALAGKESGSRSTDLEREDGKNG